MLLLVVIVVFALIIAGDAYMRLPKFGKEPSGVRLQKIKASPNYKGDKFQNQNPTPDLTDGANYYSILRDFFFNKSIIF